MSVNIRMMSGDVINITLRGSDHNVSNDSITIIEYLSEDIFTYLSTLDPENIQYMKQKEGPYKLQYPYSYRIKYMDENGLILKYWTPKDGSTYNIFIKDLPVYRIKEDTSIHLETEQDESFYLYGDCLLIDARGITGDCYRNIYKKIASILRNLDDRSINFFMNFSSLTEKEKATILFTYMYKRFIKYNQHTVFSFAS